MTGKRQNDAGLSLIEVLVSLAIFAIIGMAGLAVLNTVARTGERTEGRLERLAEIDRAFLVIRRDFAQISPTGMSLDAGRLKFLRGADGGAIQIAFMLKDGVLIRQVDVEGSDPLDQRLLPGVVKAQWRLMDGQRRWQSVWPPDPSAQIGRPFAAELTLEVRRAHIALPQTVTRLIALPAGLGQ